MNQINYIERFNTFLETASPLESPQWTTENEIIIKTEAFILRRFKPKNTLSTSIPTIIIPPQAGHSSHIADYDKNQSIVETILAQRNSDVYCIEWLSCTQKRKNESIYDLVKQVNQAFEVIGEAHLVGLCQGGWLAAVFTSLYQTKVKSLTCIAAPIDFHIDGGVIYDTSKKLGIKAYKFFVDINNGIMPGDLMLSGWKLMNIIDRYIIDYLKILKALDDDQKIKKIKKFRTWYEKTQDISGFWYLEAVENLFIKNQLIKNELKINNEIIKLSNITCPVIMLAGQKDDITLPNQLFSLENYVRSKAIYKNIITGVGHIGSFISSKSQSYIKDSVEWVDDLI